MELNTKYKIIFVDDEVNILQGLKRSLWNLRNEWDIVYATSGNEALHKLAQNRYDVIVSDMRMPNMNGIQLLSRVHELYPDMIRIVLSGHSDNELTMRSTKIAHQYLSKPCNADTIKNVIGRALDLRNILGNQEIKYLVSKMEHLPSLPDMYYQILDELNSPEPSIKNVGKIVSHDLGMSAKILQIVNSAFFGMPRHIESSEQAVHLLGLEMVRSLVLSVKIFNLVENVEIEGFSLSQLWNHSLQVQEFTKIICHREKFEKRMLDHAVVAGLLHDIGILILIANYYDTYADILKKVSETGQPLFELEKEVFNVDHATIGAYLLGIWGLPNETTEAVAYHHRSDMLVKNEVDHIMAVTVANQFDNFLLSKDTEKKFKKEYLLNEQFPNQIHDWYDECMLKYNQKKGS